MKLHYRRHHHHIGYKQLQNLMTYFGVIRIFALFCYFSLCSAGYRANYRFLSRR